MFQYINPFDIVKANYSDLDGNIKTGESGKPQRGLFLVLDVHKCNVLCAKITSHESIHTRNNSHKLSIRNHPFLISDSWIQFNKLHTFNVSNCSKIGDVAFSDRLSVIEDFTEYFGFLRLCMQKHAPSYLSPNITKRGK